MMSIVMASFRLETVATYVVSTDKVSVPDVPPPERPVPAVTPKISPLPTQADPSYDWIWLSAAPPAS
jgi:hypothetical protein